MTLPGGQDEVVSWIAEIRAQMANEELRRLAANAEKTSAAMGGVQKTAKQTEQAMDKGGKTAKQYARSIDAARIALGAIVAMAVFRVINFIEESMRKAIDTAQEFETSLYRLVNVERILSQAGAEISMEGLLKGIQDVKKELPIFSEADITQQVSLIGIMTKDMGLTEQQILDIAKAVGILNINSAETEDLMTTTQKVITAMVAPTGRGIASLGIDFGKANMEAVALSQGILKAGESFSDLTEHEKDLVKIAILMEATGEQLENVDEYLDSNIAKVQQGQAAWEDFLRSSGQLILPFKAAFFELVTIVGAYFRAQLEQTKNELIQGFAVINAVIASTAKLLRGDLIGAFSEFGDEVSKYTQIFTKMFSPEQSEYIDTITDSVEQLEGAIQDVGELEGFEKLAEDLEDFQDKIDKVNADFELKMSRMFEDFQLDQQRNEIDYRRKRADIIRDFNNRIAKQQQEYRQKEENEEAKFQERMRQLREKYLFNLEDALRERDARQVLRLQRQYQMEKQNLINEHALRTKEDKQGQQQELADLAAQRDERLRQLDEEYRIKQQREREDYEIRRARAELDHQRDLEDIRRRIDERLMEFARAIGEEYDLNEQGVDALYQLLQRYYGPDGYFDGLYKYSYDSVIARGKAMIQAMNQIIQQAVKMAQTVSGLQYGGSKTTSTGYIRNPSLQGSSGRIPTLGGFAKGGMAIARRPTHAIFGEVPELATFTPLSKLRASGMSMAGGMPGMGGEIQLSVLLSPDLEARIISSSLENVSAIFESVQREG